MSLDEIRKRKLEELMRLQQQKSEQANEQAQMQQQIEVMEESIRQLLTKEALERYGNIKAAHQEKALQLIVILYQALQKGQVHGKIDDGLLKKIIERITPKQKEFKIKRV